MAQETINALRGMRQQKNRSPKEPLSLQIKGEFPGDVIPLIVKLANVSEVSKVAAFGEESGVSLLVRTTEMFVPLGGLVNAEEEIRKIEAELEHQRGFLASVRKKLSNEAFVAHAPQHVVELERKKESDSLSKIESLEKALKVLKNK